MGLPDAICGDDFSDPRSLRERRSIVNNDLEPSLPCPAVMVLAVAVIEILSHDIWLLDGVPNILEPIDHVMMVLQDVFLALGGESDLPTTVIVLAPELDQCVSTDVMEKARGFAATQATVHPSRY
jgi:hypothetical protein